MVFVYNRTFTDILNNKKPIYFWITTTGFLDDGGTLVWVTNDDFSRFTYKDIPKEEQLKRESRRTNAYLYDVDRMKNVNKAFKKNNIAHKRTYRR